MKKILLAAVAAFGLASAAGAITLNGLTVQVDLLFPDLSTVDLSTGPVIVSSGSEGSLGFVSVDVSGNSISFSTLAIGIIWFNAEFSGFVLRDVENSFGPFSSATFTTSFLESGSPIITFDDDNLFINVAGVTFNSFTPLGTFLTVDFTIGEAAVVPLPAGLPLLLAGLGGLALLRRRRLPV